MIFWVNVEEMKWKKIKAKKKKQNSFEIAEAKLFFDAFCKKKTHKFSAWPNTEWT